MLYWTWLQVSLPKDFLFLHKIFTAVGSSAFLIEYSLPWSSLDRGISIVVDSPRSVFVLKWPQAREIDMFNDNEFYIVPG